MDMECFWFFILLKGFNILWCNDGVNFWNGGKGGFDLLIII